MTDRSEGVVPRFFSGGCQGLTPRNLAILAGIAAFACTLVIAGCLIKFNGRSSHIGITIVLLYAFLAFPLILLGRSDTGGGSFMSSSQPSGVTHVAYFLTGLFAVSGPWLAFVLARADKITWQVRFVSTSLTLSMDRPHSRRRLLSSAVASSWQERVSFIISCKDVRRKSEVGRSCDGSVGRLPVEALK